MEAQSPCASGEWSDPDTNQKMINSNKMFIVAFLSHFLNVCLHRLDLAPGRTKIKDPAGSYDMVY